MSRMSRPVEDVWGRKGKLWMGDVMKQDLEMGRHNNMSPVLDPRENRLGDECEMGERKSILSPGRTPSSRDRTSAIPKLSNGLTSGAVRVPRRGSWKCCEPRRQGVIPPDPTGRRTANRKRWATNPASAGNHRPLHRTIPATELLMT